MPKTIIVYLRRNVEAPLSFFDAIRIGGIESIRFGKCKMTLKASRSLPRLRLFRCLTCGKKIKKGPNTKFHYREDRRFCGRVERL